MPEDQEEIPQTPRQQRFLASIEGLGMQFPVARIATKLGVSESTVSTYMNKREVSEKFLRKFCKAYELDFNKIDKGENKPEHDMETPKEGKPVGREQIHTIESLLANNKLLGEAFLRQASAHEKEAEARIVQAQANKFWAEMNNKMMGKMINSSFELKNYAIPSLSVDKVSTFLADKYGIDRDAVAVELGNIAFGDAFQGKAQGNNADSDKQSK